MAVVSVSLPDELLADLDRLIARRDYQGRSEAVRAALLAFLRANKAEDQVHGRVSAICVLGYPEGVERAVTDLRHRHDDLVQSMLHAHTVKGRCATVLVADGPAEPMRRFLADLRGVRGVENVDVTLMP